MADGTDWDVIVYADADYVEGDTGRPVRYDSDTREEVGSHIRLKKNLSFFKERIPPFTAGRMSHNEHTI